MAVITAFVTIGSSRSHAHDEDGEDRDCALQCKGTKPGSSQFPDVSSERCYNLCVDSKNQGCNMSGRTP